MLFYYIHIQSQPNHKQQQCNSQMRKEFYERMIIYSDKSQK